MHLLSFNEFYEMSIKNQVIIKVLVKNFNQNSCMSQSKFKKQERKLKYLVFFLKLRKANVHQCNYTEFKYFQVFILSKKYKNVLRFLLYRTI